MQCIITEKIKLTHYDETKKMAHGPQIVRAKENLKLSYGGPSQCCLVELLAANINVLTQPYIKRILWQTVNTQMKCRRRRNFIGACTVCLDKIDLQRKKIIVFGNYDLCKPFVIYNGPSWLSCIKIYGKFHWS